MRKSLEIFKRSLLNFFNLFFCFKYMNDDFDRSNFKLKEL